MRKYSLVLLILLVCSVSCKVNPTSTPVENPKVGPDQLILSFIPRSKEGDNYECEVIEVKKMGFGVSSYLNNGDIIKVYSKKPLKLKLESTCLLDSQLSLEGSSYAVLTILSND